MTPDASRHNPDPAYLRTLLGDRNVKDTAARLGLSVRTLMYYLSDASTAPRAPYCVQYALEQLTQSQQQRAPGTGEPRA
jgi:hypothetical protein